MEGYRRSPDAAIAAGDGAVGLTREGVAEFEDGVRSILSRALAARWDESELWAEAAAMLARLPKGGEAAKARSIKRWLEQTLSTEETLVAFLASNTEPPATPISMGNLVLGRVDDQWLKAIEDSARSRPVVKRTNDVWWLTSEISDGPAATGFAAWVPARGMLAVSLAEQLFDDLIATALVLEPDPGAMDLWSMRGDAYRPGVRGVSIHRSAIGEIDDLARRELGAQIVFADSRGQRWTVHWLGERGFPIDKVLEPARRPLIEYILSSSDPLGRRLRIGARWYAKSHWAATPSDAVLALGIAFDALLAEAGGSPGRVLTDRFALLERDRAKRAGRAREAKRMYEARSAVAHGGESSQLRDPHFVRDAQEAFRRVVQSLLALSASTTLDSEAAYARAFDELKWGTLNGTP